MSKIIATHFVPGHLEVIELQEHEKEMLEPTNFCAVACGNAATTKTFFYEGKILGIGGYAKLWPGVLEVYIVPSVYFFKYPKEAVLNTHDMFKEATDDI